MLLSLAYVVHKLVVVVVQCFALVRKAIPPGVALKP